ncbi:ribosomal L7Ae/L30e/S12e/Gadd45 family protein [Peptococcaceae bacterium]|nr:ribosomal L7Ae/L30e/S12e/Gadd45 family protein [Peptococcaceae bacterium]
MEKIMGLLGLLGLAQKAGKVVSGDYLVKSAIKNKKAKLVVVASDTSYRTKKEYFYLAKLYNIPIIEASCKVELGLTVGKSFRAAVAVVDDNFARAILKG